MKNLFALNATDGKENGSLDGAFLETAKVDAAAAERMDELFRESERLGRRASPPSWISSLFYFCILAAAVIGFFFVSSLFAEGKDPIGAMTLLPIALVLGTVAVFLHRYAKRQRAAFFESDEAANLEARMKAEEGRIQASLGVPFGTAEADVISFRYKVEKDGGEKLLASGFGKYVNLVYNVWREGESLHFANWDHRITLPLSAIGAAEKVELRTLLPRWTKKASPTEAEYAPYRLEMTSYGVRIRAVYRIPVSLAEGDFEILVPEYEKERLTSLGIVIAEDAKGENKE